MSVPCELCTLSEDTWSGVACPAWTRPRCRRAKSEAPKSREKRPAAPSVCLRMRGRHDVALSLRLRCGKMQMCCISSNPARSCTTNDGSPPRQLQRGVRWVYHFSFTCILAVLQPIFEASLFLERVPYNISCNNMQQQQQLYDLLWPLKSTSDCPSNLLMNQTWLLPRQNLHTGIFGSQPCNC